MWDMVIGKTVWHGEKKDFLRAAEEAAKCRAFSFDCEEECIDDEVSCYNCRYRRWTNKSFVCMKEKQK